MSRNSHQTTIIIFVIISLIHSPVVVIILFHYTTNLLNYYFLSYSIDVRQSSMFVELYRFQVIFCLFIVVLSAVVVVSYCKDQVTLCYSNYL